MKINLPDVDTLSDYYKSYLKYISEDDLMEALIQQKEITTEFLKSIPIEKGSFRYAEGKWMLKEVIGHLSDTERILSYRALRFSRNDSTALSGFDENTYVPNSNHAQLSLKEISEEKTALTALTILLFKNMNKDMPDRIGAANNLQVSVRAILFFIIAHERHHLKVIMEKYL
ncbi:hypothetical protein LBMAG27_21800 [Bacteroidota bacterium]|nr:hypothetical protein LBMAG27_21800 [Bacteroidota bacterium]